MRQWHQHADATVTAADLAVTSTNLVKASTAQWAVVQQLQMLMPSAAVALRAHKLAWKRASNVSALVAFGVLASRWTTRETLDLRNGWSLTADSHGAILQTFADAIWHPLHVDRREALIERRP